MAIHKVVMFGASEGCPQGWIERELKKLIKRHGKSKLLVISGGAPGVDTQVEIVCMENSIHCAVIKALWSTRYKGAGPQRNAMMAALEPHQGIGFHPDFPSSRGTKDMYKKLKALGIPAKLVEK